MTPSDPFRASDALRAGQITRGKLRGPDYTRLAPDTWVASGSEDDVRRRVLALDVWSRHGGVIGGPLAALAWGAECPWNDAELVMSTSRRITPAGTTVRVDRLLPDEIAERWGVPVTTPVRTAFDLARRGPLVEAVAAVDALAHVCRFGAEDLLALAERHPGVRGIVQVRRVAELMDPRAESCMESRTRLVFVLRGLRAPVVQHEVHLPTGRWYRLDLGWPDVPEPRPPVGVEYDGPHHRTIEGQNRDNHRNADLDDLGWDVVHVSSAQVLVPRHADRLAERIRRKIT
jgi:hypothetical protein